MLRRSVLSLAVTGVVAAVLSSAPALADTAAEKKNAEVALAFLDTVFNKHKVKEGFDAYVGSQYKQHNPNVPDGIEAGVGALTYFTSQKYPKMRMEVKRSAAQGDLVFVHWRQLRDDQDVNGVAVVDIFRLEKGKIVEHWDVLQDVPDPAKSANKNGMF